MRLHMTFDPLKRVCVLGRMTLGVCVECASLQYMGGCRISVLDVCACHTHKPAGQLADSTLQRSRCVFVCVCQTLSYLGGLSQAGEEWSGVPTNTKHNNEITEPLCSAPMIPQLIPQLIWQRRPPCSTHSAHRPLSTSSRLLNIKTFSAFSATCLIPEIIS